jgi:predicted O-methyltransferase YrrM
LINAAVIDVEGVVMNNLSDQEQNLDKFCDRLCNERPKWITGSLSHADTRFLFKKAIESRSETAVELGTASGFSTAVLCHALNWASNAGMISGTFQVLSYDLSPSYYADPRRRVGDAAREQLPAELLKHIIFHNPATAASISEHHGDGDVSFMFIDANHDHPWPALDLLASLNCIRTGATVVLHDINLPLIRPEFPSWGAKYLFDDLNVEKHLSEDKYRLPNAGSIIIPADRERLKEELCGIVFAHEWQAEIDDQYLRRLGIDGNSRQKS